MRNCVADARQLIKDITRGKPKTFHSLEYTGNCVGFITCYVLALAITVHSSIQTYPRFEFRDNVLTSEFSQPLEREWTTLYIV